MNTKSKLNKKSMKIITTIMLSAVFIIGEIFSPFAILANADSTQTIRVTVKEVNTAQGKGQRINGAKITFNGPGGSGKIAQGTSGVGTDAYGNTVETGVCYIDVHNGKEKNVGITAEKDGYEVYNIYDNYGKYYVRKGIPENDFQPTGSWKSPSAITIELKNISSIPEVKIDVTDASGTLDQYYVNSDNTSQRVDRDVTDKNYVLKGDAYANFSLKSDNADKFQYSIIKNNGKQTDMPTSGWNDIDLKAETVNQDVVLDKNGYLTQRAYDVNHMLTLTDRTNWSDPTQVFKYPYPEIVYKSTDTSTTKEAYGKMEKVVPYTITDVNNKKITVDSRWVSNTVFMSNMDIFGGYKEASKFWGYITVPEDGSYIFGAVSDDGCRGWITVDGEAKQFVDMFYPQGATFGTKNVTLNLKADKYYPLYLEYFNWGGSAAFQLNYVKNQSKLTNSNKISVPKAWFYPSKSTSPGEYAQTLFTGSKGVKLPNDPGQYYIAYRTGTKNSDGSFNKVSREGIYGPFIVKPTATLELKREVNTSPLVGSSFEINYTITPKPIPSEYFSSTNTQNFEITNMKFSEYLPTGLIIDEEKQKLYTDKLEIVQNTTIQNGINIDGNLKGKIIYAQDSTKAQYIAQPISFSIWVKSDTAANYNMLGKDSYITYLDIDNGTRSANFNDLNFSVSKDNIPPELTLTQDPTIKTNGTVTITAVASDNVAVASITKPDNSIVQFNPATPSNSTTYIVTENGQYTFKATDTSGNVTTQSITVSNIDKTAPAMPIISGNPANSTITKDRVAISIDYSSDSAIKQYRINGGEWVVYTGPFDVRENCLIEAQGIDEVGNKSEIAKYTVNNIDNTPPTLALTQSPTSPTNGTVTITAVASDSGSGVASITKPDNTVVTGNYTTYTVNANGTYTFKATDNVGNVTTQSITVSNIDKIDPTLTLIQSPTAPTNGTVTITATASDSESGVASITKPGDIVVTGSSTTYTVSANGTYTFTATDNAGNVTTQSITVSNIDKVAPTLTLTQSPTAPTIGPVTITATASDSESGVASITKPDDTVVPGSSTTYTVSANGTYTFKATDNAGNVTTQSITVSNIIDGQSIVLKHGLYNGNGINITEQNELKVTNGIPVTMAMIIDVESSNPVISWSASKTKIPQEQIIFKKYEILDDGTIGNLETVTLTNDGDINITGFTMEKGKQYIITYTITPVGNEQIITSVGSDEVTVTATADVTSTKRVKLNIGATPDLF